MALLDLQRQGQQIGRLRIGQLVRTENGKQKPVRLDTFRFTTQSTYAARAVAELYGGEVRDWNNEYEVVTDFNEIGVTVPPRDEVVTQWYEMWSKGGAKRRCNSQIETLSGGPCLCPHSEDPGDLEQVHVAALERARLAKMNPPRACKTVTRISVRIPDLPGLGVWRLDTGSYWAAVEIGDAAAVMQVARDRGVILPATLRIEHRKRVKDGQTTNFPVPVLDVLVTFRQIATGALEAGGLVAQLPPPPSGVRRALTSGQPASAAAAPARQAAPAQPPMTAQQIADSGAKALSRAQIEALAKQAETAGLGEDLITSDGNTFEVLNGYLQDLWRALPAPDQPKQGDVA